MIDVRANLYNLFNNLNLTPFGFFDPGIFADSPQFGRATQPGLAGRVVEFQGRSHFESYCVISMVRRTLA